MTRSLTALLLSLVFLVQGAIGSPVDFEPVPSTSAARKPTPCRCCDCGGMACCAAAPVTPTPLADHATPPRVVPAQDLVHPPAPLPASLSARLFPPRPSLPLPVCPWLKTPAAAPSRLLGGGLLL